MLAPVRGERELGDIEDELFRFMRIVEGNDELRVALTTAELSRGQGQGRPGAARGPRPAGVGPHGHICRRVGRPRDFPVLLEALVELVAKEANRRMADVRSAVEMTAKQRSRLAAALTKFTGYPVDVSHPEPRLARRFCCHHRRRGDRHEPAPPARAGQGACCTPCPGQFPAAPAPTPAADEEAARARQGEGPMKPSGGRGASRLLRKGFVRTDG